MNKFNQLWSNLRSGFWFLPSLIVPARQSGYIQSVDNAALLRLAGERKAIVRMALGIGELVIQDAMLATLALEDPPDQETIAALQAASAALDELEPLCRTCISSTTMFMPGSRMDTTGGLRRSKTRWVPWNSTALRLRHRNPGGPAAMGCSLKK